MSTRRRGGQAVIEYVLLMVMVIGSVFLFMRFLPEQLGRYERQITEGYANSYRFGDAAASGDDGNYVLHPRVSSAGNFRMWKRTQ